MKLIYNRDNKRFLIQGKITLLKAWEGKERISKKYFSER